MQPDQEAEEVRERQASRGTLALEVKGLQALAVEAVELLEVQPLTLLFSHSLPLVQYQLE